MSFEVTNPSLLKIGEDYCKKIEEQVKKKNLKVTCSIGDRMLMGAKELGYNISFELTTPRSSHFISWEMSQLPGCCMYLTCFHMYITDKYRGKGLGTLLQSMKEEIARYLGYTFLICTVTDNNESQKKVLEKTGWKMIHQEENKRSCNIVNMYIKKV